MIEKNVLESMTIKQLFTLEAVKRIKGRHGMKKAQLIQCMLELNEVAETVPEALASFEADAVASECEWEEKCPEGQAILNKVFEAPKQQYINNMQLGALVAFKVNESKVLSGMIEKMDANKTTFIINTKTQIRFTVLRKNIIWVKTGERWPKGVYKALRGMTEGGDDNAKHQPSNIES